MAEFSEDGCCRGGRQEFCPPGAGSVPVSARREIYTVSEITGSLRQTLETAYGRVRVRGEITGFRKPSSGHLYFALKDERAQLRAVMFRSAAVGLRFFPADGLEVEAEGDISLYEPRGDLQLIVERMIPSGLGALMRAFENLKKRLAAEGLFARERKKPLPVFPRTIGLVTSPTGAAIRDLVHVLRSRWPLAKLVLAPVRVQGEGAAEEIAAAVERMSRWGGADVMIVGRGGGSVEDLWAFNEERVVRAVANATTPVVSAVGHETDVSLTDLAADVRAATPSSAAAIVVPERREVVARLLGLEEAMRGGVRAVVEARRTVLQRLVQAYGFRRPERFLEREQQRLDEAAEGLRRAMGTGLETKRSRLWMAISRLIGRRPEERVRGAQLRLATTRSRLRQALTQSLGARRQAVAGLRRAMKALDPTAVLARGYCLAREPESGRVVSEAKGLAPGASLLVQFHKDRARTRVETVEQGGPWQVEE